MADNYLDEQTKKLQEFYNQQEQQKLAAAQAERDKNLGSLDQQLNSGLPSFVTQRNQADYNSALDSQRAKEIAASMGSNQSGDYVNMQGRLFTNRQNTFNQINTDENKFRTDITNKKNDINSGYMLNETNIKTTIAAELARQRQVLMEAERARQIQIAEAEKQRQWEAAEKEKQRLWDAEQARIARAAAAARSYSGGNDSYFNGGNVDPYNSINNDYYNAMMKGPGYGGQYLSKNRNNIVDAVGQDYFNQLQQAQYQAAQEKNKRDQRERNKTYQKY